MKPDGTGTSAFWGNQSYWPDLLMDIYGNRELIYEGAFHALYAMPIGPRPKDPVIPDRVDWAGAQKDGKAIEPGVFYCQDVYQDSPEILRGKARYLRVIPWLEEDGIEGASPMERQAANDLSKIPLEHPGAAGACTGAGSSTRAADTGTSASFPLRDC